MDRDDIHNLLAELASVDPEVVFHEPINPRGSNFELIVAGAEAAGQTDLATAMVDIRGTDWPEYATQHF